MELDEEKLIDGVVVSSARDQLELWTYEPSTGAFALQRLGAPMWADVERIHAVDLDGDGTKGIVGLSPSGLALFHLPDPLGTAAEEVIQRVFDAVEVP